MRIRGILSVLLAFISFSAVAQQDALLWKVSKEGFQDSYLFGTYHLLPGSFAREIKGVKQAFAGADAVVTELDAGAESAAGLMQYMLLEEGTLDSLLGPERFDTLSSAIQERLGMSAMMFNKMKPMGVYIMLASAGEIKEMRKSIESKDQPMDQWFQTEAAEKKKSTLALETAEKQADLLFNSSDAQTQADMLMQYLRLNKDEAQAENDKILTCYKKQDLDCLLDYLNNADMSAIEKDLMLKDRNVLWIPMLKQFMGSQACFVAVGALHLAGPDGLIALLRAEGYRVTPVKSRKDI
ncbi:MAG: TraB/GumN family protein [Bacteroidia bacterium]